MTRSGLPAAVAVCATAGSVRVEPPVRDGRHDHAVGCPQMRLTSRPMRPDGGARGAHHPCVMPHATRDRIVLARRHRAIRLAMVCVVSLGLGLTAISQPAGSDPAQAAPQAPSQVGLGASGPQCTPETIGGSDYQRCVLPSDADVVDLMALPYASREAPIWIQAWGGKGGDSGTAAPDSVSAVGGAAGFAQTLTTVADYEAQYGTTLLHYALSDRAAAHVGDDAGAGRAGDGGASTVVSSIDPSGALAIGSNVVLIAGGGGGAAVACPQYNTAPCQAAAGGAGAAALSNATQQVAAEPGENGGAAGASGVGGASGDDEFGGGSGIGGFGGGSGIGGFGGGAFGTTWFNDLSLLELPGGDGGSRDEATFSGNPGVYRTRGGGGGGWGGGASGFFSPADQPRASAGGGAGSFAAPSSVADPNAPVAPPQGPASGSGEVHVVVLAEGSGDPPTCTGETIAGSEYLRCVLSDTASLIDLVTLPGTTDSTTLWIQAWGGKAADGGPSTPDGAIARVAPPASPKSSRQSTTIAPGTEPRRSSTSSAARASAVSALQPRASPARAERRRW